MYVPYGVLIYPKDDALAVDHSYSICKGCDQCKLTDFKESLTKIQ